MCGIAGVIGEIPSAERSQAALNSLFKRGPDSEGSWSDLKSRVWLGNRRLAILDPGASGAQPMIHPDTPEIVVTYNGEIYNYESLRRELEVLGCRFRTHCDTELLLHAYAAWGTNLLQRVEGMFAFALYDGTRDTLFLARDPVGQKPLYYHRKKDSLFFGSTSSEVKALCPSLSRVSGKALCFVMTHGYVPSPFSAWEGIEVLPPGHFALWTAGELRTFRYWAPPDEIIGGNMCPDEFGSLFSSVCSEHILSDVPVGLFLSGGLDSSTVACVLSAMGHRVQCFALGYGNDPDSEAPIAAQTAKHLCLPLDISEFTQSQVETIRNCVADGLADPMAPNALLSLYAIAQRAAQKVKVVLSGDGGDELFGGYPWYQKRRFSARRLIKNLWKPRRSSSNEIASVRSFEDFAARSVLHSHAVSISRRFLPHEANALFAPLSPQFTDEAMIAPLEQHFVSKLPLTRALQRVDLMTFCSGQVVPKVDRMAMANSLEVRSPFLDRRMINWALSRDDVEPTRGREKMVLRRFLGGRVPDAVLSHRKQGFGLRGVQYDLGKLISEIDSSRLVRDGLLIPRYHEYVEVQPKKLREHRIWTIASIAKWYEAHSLAR